MNADGSDQRRLTFSPSEDDFARWAPSGRSLVFMSKRDGPRAVYAINVASGAARRVARHGQFPDWTTDGRILFRESPSVSGALFTVRPYGAQRRPLRTQPGSVLAARVSRDGTKMVYVSRDFDIFSALIDGADSSPLATSAAEENDPVWSPDGEWVAFDARAARTGKSEIYVIRADGTEKTRITFLGTACCAAWSATASSS